MPKYNVHVFAVIRLRVDNVEADDHLSAIEKAETEVWDNHRQFSQEFKVPEGMIGIADTELADGESPVCFLVDEQGDTDYQHTRWYNADKKPDLGDKAA